MKYFEMYMRSDLSSPGDQDEIAMCGKGERVPTVEEANSFYVADVNGYGQGNPIRDVFEITEAEAAAFYDCANVEYWPVFK